MPIKQTIEIVWQQMTERPPRFDRYLVAESNCVFKYGQHKKVLAGNSNALFAEAVKLDKKLKELNDEE